MISIAGVTDFQTWRTEARKLLQDGVSPDLVHWEDGSEKSLFSLVSQSSAPEGSPESAQSLSLLQSNPSRKVFSVPPEFLEKARLVAQARDPHRWDLLYRLLFRIQKEPHLLKVRVDSDVERFEILYKQITRDIHKMHAFVRFKKGEIEGQEFYFAWHSPDHRITELAATFFVRRFGDKPWVIFTPDITVSWDGEKTKTSPGIPQNQFDHADDFDLLWKSYYKSIFNPARLKIKAMKAELPTRFWNSLPEAALIPELIRDAPHRLQTMAKNQNQMAVVPGHSNLKELATLNKACQACPLFQSATQTVTGEGPSTASIMIVGEQPGDQEDLEGRPFVGPAGQILNECLKNALLDRDSLFLTNAVKHFKWERNGTMRLHKKASGQEMHACRPWLEAEVALVKPKIIIALGVTAGTAVIGRLPKISAERGRWLTGNGLADKILLSWHPSAILRSSSEEERQQRMQELTSDLRMAALALAREEMKEELDSVPQECH